MSIVFANSLSIILHALHQVLLGQQYTQKSDIHSLALVIWEIISAGRVVKFYTNNNRDNSVHQSQGIIPRFTIIVFGKYINCLVVPKNELSGYQLINLGLKVV